MRPRQHIILVLLLIGFGVAMRFLPHPANVAPIAALALFSGVYLTRWYAFAIPLGAMVISDLFIGLHDVVAFTWGSFVAIGLIGLWVRRRKNVGTIVLGSLAGSVIFYVVTNWAVWAFTPLYEKNASGLAQSYIMALPFFRNTILGDLFYTGLLFGAYALAAYIVRRTRPAPAHVLHHES